MKINKEDGVDKTLKKILDVDIENELDENERLLANHFNSTLIRSIVQTIVNNYSIHSIPSG